MQVAKATTVNSNERELNVQDLPCRRAGITSFFAWETGKL